jgi:hypothetical protein
MHQLGRMRLASVLALFILLGSALPGEACRHRRHCHRDCSVCQTVTAAPFGCATAAPFGGEMLAGPMPPPFSGYAFFYCDGTMYQYCPYPRPAGMTCLYLQDGAYPNGFWHAPCSKYGLPKPSSPK